MQETYLKKAKENAPKLHEEIITPEIPRTIMQTGDELLIDLGNHYVGYFSFKLNDVDIFIDAPVRLSVRFCERERELRDAFETYKGELCKSWLQEEIINLDFPEEYKMPRRYAARYIKIKVLATPQKFFLSDFAFRAVSSADTKKLSICNCDEDLKKIDSVAVNTLKDCMQRVFEDGPKRDRRLWTGDLRLEALTNYYTFRNLELVRYCLYLFAAAPVNYRGFIPGYVYEYPYFAPGTWFLQDYLLFFVVTACDYFEHTDNKETFLDLYPAIKGQMDAMHATVGSDGIMTAPEDCGAFIDWCAGLEKITSLHGVYLYTLQKLTDVLTALGHADKTVYADRYENARTAAETILYDKGKQRFINAKDNFQYSVHSAVWMILGGVVTGTCAEEILFHALQSADSVKPFTPYMHHYVLEAMEKLGLTDEIRAYIKKYWGGMVADGADTFYEAYVPEDPEFSPYGDRKINSMCHAWSCTPAYFIRKYFAK